MTKHAYTAPEAPRDACLPIVDFAMGRESREAMRRKRMAEMICDSVAANSPAVVKNAKKCGVCEDSEILFEV